MRWPAKLYGLSAAIAAGAFVQLAHNTANLSALAMNDYQSDNKVFLGETVVAKATAFASVL